MTMKPTMLAKSVKSFLAKVSVDDWKGIRRRLGSTGEGYSNLDGDPRGDWVSVPFSAQPNV